MDVATPTARVLVVLGNATLHGQERGNIEVYRALQADGVDALFVTHTQWGGQQIEPFLARLGLRSTPLTYAYHFRRGMTARDVVRNLRRLLAGSRAFWKIARAYRPTHIHVANLHYVLCVVPALWLLRVPVVYRLGDVPTLHHALYRVLWKWGVIPRVSRFVCISEYVAEAAVASGVPRETICVVLSAPPGRAQSEEERPPDLARPEGRTVLFVGQVAEHKGVHLLIEAAAVLSRRHPALRFLVAGHAQPPFARRLGAQMLAAGVADRVRFLGYVEDVDGLFASADIHVCPSICREALGNVVLEAKRAGVPSVVFPDGGLPELITEPGLDGVVCEASTVEALVDGIEHYLALSDDALSEAGRAARVSLGTLGSDEATFRARWLDALGLHPTPPDPPSREVGA